MRDSHQSSKNDAPLTSKLLLAYDLGNSCTTAVVTEAHKIIAPCYWNGWGGETRTYWNTRFWDKLEKGVYNIPTPRWNRGTTIMDNLPIYWVHLRHKKQDFTLLRLGGHHPAHLHKVQQERANTAIIEHMPYMLQALEVQLNPDLVTYSADYNLGLDNVKHRRFVNENLPDNYKLIVPPGRTHRLRKIDAAVTNGKVGPVDMFPWYKGIDHRGFAFEVSPR